MRVEQAVFTSRATSRALGYQLVARSPGISETDARALAQWGPSHDALGEAAADEGSVNFFSLPSGAYCVSKTVLAGSEYSGRAGGQVYTQMLVVDRQGLGRFAYHPLALLNAAIAQGSIEVLDRFEGFLPALQLPGRAAAFDAAPIAALVDRRGASWLARLLGAVVAYQPLAVLGAGNPRAVLAALFHCLPTECRGELSFTTGLRFSPRRPFRLTFLPDDLVEARRLARAYDVNLLLAVDEGDVPAAAEQGWAALVAETLRERDWDRLRELVTAPADSLRLATLDDWARSHRPVPPMAVPALNSAAPAATNHGRPAAPGAAGGPSFHRRAHAAHRRPRPDEIDEERLAQASQVLAELASAPADILGSHRPDTTARLERLDDTVFEAIAGKQRSLEELKTLWPEVLAELGEGLIEESRLQYLRHALTVWKECVDGDEIRQSARALRALVVLCLLFDEPLEGGPPPDPPATNAPSGSA